MRLLFSTGAGAPPPARTNADASPRLSWPRLRHSRRRSRPHLTHQTYPTHLAHLTYPMTHLTSCGAQ